MYKPLPFETLRDATGQVTVGWAGDSVIHSKVEGGMSAALGKRFAEHLHRLIEHSLKIHYFSDVSMLTEYDLLARSAFVRMALAHRRRFASFTFLMWPAGVSDAARAFASALGADTELCVDAEEFARKLTRLAPLAKHRLDPASWERAEPHVRLPR
jgi:hypothetical protein